MYKDFFLFVLYISCNQKRTFLGDPSVVVIIVIFVLSKLVPFVWQNRYLRWHPCLLQWWTTTTTAAAEEEPPQWLRDVACELLDGA